MADVRRPAAINVRLHWKDGRIETVGTLEGPKLECSYEDTKGTPHRFVESGVIDTDGYHIFKQVD
jgi:hypothetical protein